MNQFRQFLRSGRGRVIVSVLVVASAVVTYFVWRAAYGESEAHRTSAHRMFICSQTGKTFEAELLEGTAAPVKSPYSGKDTGYPAELCYWTADGREKETPTYVLLNKYTGGQEPTYCPDCGRLVVGHNPRAAAGVTPPPKKEEAGDPAPIRRN